VGGLHLVFATSEGNVAATGCPISGTSASGLIAMNWRGTSRWAWPLREGDDVLLATRLGKAIRFRAEPETLRLFAGRDSTGVRGIRLAEGDSVIALSVLRHSGATADERAAYLKAAAAHRRAPGEEAEAAPAEDGEEAAGEIALSPERFEALAGLEEMILAVTDGGFGKRTSSHEYRVTGRGGQGDRRITPLEAHGQCGRRTSGAYGRPSHARHRWRPAHPHPGRCGAHHRPPGHGRDADAAGRRRAGDLLLPRIGRG